jgi:hypothetical protein
MHLLSPDPWEQHNWIFILEYTLIVIITTVGSDSAMLTRYNAQTLDSVDDMIFVLGL